MQSSKKNRVLKLFVFGKNHWISLSQWCLEWALQEQRWHVRYMLPWGPGIWLQHPEISAWSIGVTGFNGASKSKQGREGGLPGATRGALTWRKSQHEGEGPIVPSTLADSTLEGQTARSHQKEVETWQTRKASWAFPWELNCQELISERLRLSAKTTLLQLVNYIWVSAMLRNYEQRCQVQGTLGKPSRCLILG